MSPLVVLLLVADVVTEPARRRDSSCGPGSRIWTCDAPPALSIAALPCAHEQRVQDPGPGGRAGGGGWAARRAGSWMGSHRGRRALRSCGRGPERIGVQETGCCCVPPLPRTTRGGGRRAPPPALYQDSLQTHRQAERVSRWPRRNPPLKILPLAHF